MNVCKNCSNDFTDRSRTKTKKFCSDKCRVKHRDLLLGKGISAVKSCKHCEQKFSTTYRRKIFCSKRCSDASSFKYRGHPAAKRRFDFVYEDKLAKGCSRCPERRPSCLQYHHINPSEKTDGIGKMIQTSPMENLVKEMAKCIILCANCHFVEENGDGYKPEDRPNV